MSLLRMLYLALAVVGALLPVMTFMRQSGESAADPLAFIATRYDALAGSGLMWNLAVAATALSVWVIAEVYVRRNWRALWAIPATYLIGLSCGLPLYLFLRTAPVK